MRVLRLVSRHAEHMPPSGSQQVSPLTSKDFDYPLTLTSMGNLALTYRNQGRWKEAEELDLQVMDTRKKVLGQEHPDTPKSMNNLAWTWRGQNRDYHYQGRHEELTWV